MGKIRLHRISDELKRLLSEILLRDFPVSQYGLITVTNVDCSPDLGQAKIYISVYNKDENLSEKTLQKIKYRASRIRSELSHKIVLKKMPKLLFIRDETQDYAEKIEKLIRKIHEDDNSDD